MNLNSNYPLNLQIFSMLRGFPHFLPARSTHTRLCVCVCVLICFNNKSFHLFEFSPSSLSHHHNCYQTHSLLVLPSILTRLNIPVILFRVISCENMG
ncbi:hypothetical protein Hanom_Chr02g00165121 [Helianthus anomalus]